MSVQNERDYREYKDAGIGGAVGTFLFKPANSAAGNRNTLLSYAKPGERIVLIDDDVKYISRLQGGALKKVESLEQFERMITKGFALAQKHHTIGFGLYPVHNAYFMSCNYAPANICDAGLFAIINTSMRFDEQLATKEDYDFCCRAIKNFGAFIRLNEYALNSPAGHKGGCEDAWNNVEENARIARFLVAKYPDIIQLNPRRPGEVKMKRRSK